MLHVDGFTVSYGPTCGAAILLSVPNCEKAVVHLMEEIYALDKLPSSMNSYSTVGCEFNVNE